MNYSLTDTALFHNVFSVHQTQQAFHKWWNLEYNLGWLTMGIYLEIVENT